MVAGEVGVDLAAGLAEADVLEAGLVGLRQLLLDDVGLDGDADVVRLASEVCGHVVVHTVLLERAVARVAPQHGELV